MDIVVVNGLALGCDMAAIKGALAGKGRCVVIMPSGLNNIFPKVNFKLADEMLANGGCIISEYEPDFVPQKYSYVQRDRLQSTLSQGVLVVEADEDSGTMHTNKVATQQKRHLAAYLSKLSVKSGNKYIIDKENCAVADVKSLTDDSCLFGTSIL